MLRILLSMILLTLTSMSAYGATCDECSDTCGNYLAEFDGVPAYSNGEIDTCTTTGGGPYQCVEYIKRFHGIASGAGNGVDYYHNLPTFDPNGDDEPDYDFTSHPNGGATAPEVGDILGFSGYTYGHVGIIKEVTANKIEIIDQNRSSSDATFKCDLTRSNGNYIVSGCMSGYTIQGWIRNNDYDPPCTTVINEIYSNPIDMTMVVADPEETDYNLNIYYYGEESLTLLDRGDMGSEYANPVVNNAEPNPENKQRWLVGDVNNDGYDDMVLIAHNNGEAKAQVWISNGDGSFPSHSTWLTSSTLYDEYLLSVSGDLIAGDNTSSGIDWYKCETNGTNGFNSCSLWEQLGGDLNDDIFLSGDFTGNGNSNLLRGYTPDDSSQEACPIDGHDHPKLRWRLLKNGGSIETWESEWGCPNADYVVGDVTGDGKSDLIQIRHDTSSIGRVFVLPSTGSDFGSSSRWRKDFGSSSHNYWSYDVNQDGCDDLIDYRDNINVIFSDCVDGFDSKATLASGVDKESGGAFRFGNFGQLALLEGTEDVCVPRGAAAISNTPENTETPIFIVWEPDLGDWYWMTSSGSDMNGSNAADPGEWAEQYKSYYYTPFYTDVNGDSLPDLVTYQNLSGSWLVQLGDGYGGFTDDGIWRMGYGTSSDTDQYQAMLGDVDGDGLPDAIIYEPGYGYWYVAYNTGYSFTDTHYLVLSDWAEENFAGQYQAWAADVTGDGVVEFVVWEPNYGYWYVAVNSDPSTDGAAYTNDGLWANGWALESSDGQYICNLADVDADGDVDVIAYEWAGGDHHVMTSNGSSFSGAGYFLENWATSSSSRKYVSYYVDVNFDGIVDLVLWEPNMGRWYVAPGTGTSFTASSTIWLEPGAEESYVGQYYPVPLME